MILFESILDGIRDIRDNFGRTMLQLTGIILGAASIVATFSLSVAGKAQSMKFYRMSGGIEKIWINDKPTGKVTLDAKALASRGLTWTDVVALKRGTKQIDLVSPVSGETMTIRYREVEKPRNVMAITPAYSPMNDFNADKGRFVTDNDVATAARVVVLGTERAREFFGSDDPIGKTLFMNGTGYQVVGVMEQKYFSFDNGEHNALRWMNRQMYIPITTYMSHKGESLQRGKVSWMHARMRDEKKYKEAMAEIESIFKREHGVKDFEVISRVVNLRLNEQNNKMYDVLFLVCCLILLIVGGIVVMNI